MYSGFIAITSGAETQRVAYLGAVGNLRDRRVLDTTDAFFGVPLPALLNATGDPQDGVTAYTLAPDDQPAAVFRLAFGSPRARLDLVPKDFKVPAVHARRGLLGWLFGSGADALAGVKTLGVIQEFDYAPRSSDAPVSIPKVHATLDDMLMHVAQDTDDNGWVQIPINGTFADGSTFGNGEYKVLLSALRVTGNPALLSDYEFALTPEFIVKEN